ncbi:MAG: hypothetical protein DRO40_07070 [Thermoprotei archaeon]|nr:MAG: hypothetical protein DRO40_07070 [Thermoprotei archaeon]
MHSIINDKYLEKLAYEIAKRTFEKISLEEEQEAKNVTANNLRNILDAATEALDKGVWEIFVLKTIYVARQARDYDPLYYFVRRLLRELNNVARENNLSTEQKLRLAHKTAIACVYMYTALKTGFRKLIYMR